MNRFRTIKLVFALFILILPLLASNCCRSRFLGDGKFALTVEDTSNGNFSFLDSLDLSVIDAPNPNAGNSLTNPSGFSRYFFVNPKDTVSKAQLTYKGISDTVTVYYSSQDLFFDNCRKIYGIQTKLYYVAYTAHWLGNRDGKTHVHLPYKSDSFQNFENSGFIQLFGKK